MMHKLVKRNSLGDNGHKLLYHFKISLSIHHLLNLKNKNQLYTRDDESKPKST